MDKRMRRFVAMVLALVLCAVFVPMAFLSGVTGQFYKQFAVTIAISTVISAINSLTLSPALAALFDFMRKINRLADENKLDATGAEAVLCAFRDFDRVIGCFDVDNVKEENAIPAEVTALAEARAAARKEKNWAESDRLRDEIAKLGYTIKDAPGNVWQIQKI